MKQIYTLENVTKEAKKYNTKKDFFTKSSGHYDAAKRMKVLNIICAHMEKRKAPNKKWSIDSLSEVARKHQTREEFRQKDWTAYRAAVKSGLLDQITAHMPLLKQPVGTWTIENLQKEALKYEYKNDFLQNSSVAYATASKKGILDKICSHMTRSQNISSSEKSLFDTIKCFYPKTQILRDRNIKIENKPHITGFDIDIYVPELRKGIEFDGKYYHSVSGLKRGRPNWPEEDLINYHQIKNDYFKSKGIEILHIKEVDWNSNKDDCINKCMEFLK